MIVSTAKRNCQEKSFCVCDLLSRVKRAWSCHLGFIPYLLNIGITSLWLESACAARYLLVGSKVVARRLQGRCSGVGKLALPCLFMTPGAPSLGVREQGPDTANSQGAIIGSANLFMSSGHITGSPWSSEVWVSMSCSSHLPSIFLLFPSSWPLAPLVSSLVSPGLVLFDVHDAE